MGGDKVVLDGAPAYQVRERAVPQPDVRLRRAGEVEVAVLRHIGPARVDDDVALATGAGLLHAAKQHRMSPGGVVAREDDQVGKIEVFVTAGDEVCAERQFAGDNGGGHAKPGIGVDVARADEALHQLVGGVIVFGKQLAGDVKRYRVATVPRDGILEPLGDEGGRARPGNRTVANDRPQQPAFETDGLAKRRAFGAQPSKIRRVSRVAGDRDRPACRPRRDTATYATIRAGRQARGGVSRHGRRPTARSARGRLPRERELVARSPCRRRRPWPRPSPDRCSSCAGGRRPRGRGRCPG